MPKTAKTFDRFNLIRRIAREMFVNGYRGYSDYLDTHTVQERRYAERTGWIRNCLYNCVQWPERGQQWISCDQMRIAVNPLNRLLQANKMTNAFSYTLVLALCHMLQDGAALSLAAIMKHLDECYGIASKEEKSKVVEHLQRHTAAGWLRKNDDGRYQLSFLPYTAGNTGLFDRWPALLDAITFFSGQSALGVIGSQILDLCEAENEVFVFKHMYIAQVLDAIILNDVLQAIQTCRPVRICAEHTSSSIAERIRALPVKVLSSTQDGRQYVLIYDIDKKRYRSIRLDTIERVSPLDVSRKAFTEQTGQTVESTLAGGESCLQTLWGSTVAPCALHVSVLFEYDPRKEDHVRLRVQRETRGKGQLTEERPGLLRYECDVDHPMDMAPWLLSLTGYVKALEADDRRNTHRLKNRFTTHIRTQYDLYHARDRRLGLEPYELQPACSAPADGKPEKKQEIMSSLYAGFLDICRHVQPAQGEPCKTTRRELLLQINSAVRKTGFDSMLLDAMLQAGCLYKPVTYEQYQPVSDELLREWRKLKDQSELFLGVNSCYVYVYRYILRRLSKPAAQVRIQSLINDGIRKYGFEDTSCDISFQSMLECGMIRECTVTEKDEAGRQLYEACMQIPPHGLYRALTNIELRWIRAILDDPRMQLFLDPDAIGALKELLKAWKPLYRPGDIVYYDAYTDGDAYGDPQYIAHFRQLYRLIQDGGSPVRIAYLREKDKARKHASPAIGTVYPLRLEYSKRDDKFRLLTYAVPGAGDAADSPLSARSSGLLPLRLSNIVSVCQEDCGHSAPPDCQWQTIAGKELCKEPIEVLVAGRHKARERFMIALMPYRKEVQYDANRDECRVRIWYSSAGVNELITALRSYGDAVEVLGPKKIRADIIRRVNQQYAYLSKADTDS